MKQLLYSLLLILLVLSCGNTAEADSKKEMPDKKVEKPTKKKKNKENKVKGSFNLNIDGKTYKSGNLIQNYCDINKFYDGDKSSLTVRFKDQDTEESLILILFGSESFIDNPVSTITNLGFSSTDLPRATLSFIGGEYPIHKSFNLGTGELVIQEYKDGFIKGKINGTGGALKDIMQKQNLVNVDGSFSLETKNLNSVRK